MSDNYIVTVEEMMQVGRWPLEGPGNWRCEMRTSLLGEQGELAAPSDDLVCRGCRPGWRNGICLDGLLYRLFIQHSTAWHRGGRGGGGGHSGA